MTESIKPRWNSRRFAVIDMHPDSIAEMMTTIGQSGAEIIGSTDGPGWVPDGTVRFLLTGDGLPTECELPAGVDWPLVSSADGHRNTIDAHILLVIMRCHRGQPDGIVEFGDWVVKGPLSEHPYG